MARMYEHIAVAGFSEAIQMAKSALSVIKAFFKSYGETFENHKFAKNYETDKQLLTNFLDDLNGLKAEMNVTDDELVQIFEKLKSEDEATKRLARSKFKEILTEMYGGDEEKTKRIYKTMESYGVMIVEPGLKETAERNLMRLKASEEIVDFDFLTYRKGDRELSIAIMAGANIKEQCRSLNRTLSFKSINKGFVYLDPKDLENVSPNKIKEITMPLSKYKLILAELEDANVRASVKIYDNQTVKIFFEEPMDKRVIVSCLRGLAMSGTKYGEYAAENAVSRAMADRKIIENLNIFNPSSGSNIENEGFYIINANENQYFVVEPAYSVNAFGKKGTPKNNHEYIKITTYRNPNRKDNVEPEVTYMSREDYENGKLQKFVKGEQKKWDDNCVCVGKAEMKKALKDYTADYQVKHGKVLSVERAEQMLLCGSSRGANGESVDVLTKQQLLQKILGIVPKNIRQQTEDREENEEQIKIVNELCKVFYNGEVMPEVLDKIMKKNIPENLLRLSAESEYLKKLPETSIELATEVWPSEDFLETECVLAAEAIAKEELEGTEYTKDELQEKVVEIYNETDQLELLQRRASDVSHEFNEVITETREMGFDINSLLSLARSSDKVAHAYKMARNIENARTEEVEEQINGLMQEHIRVHTANRTDNTRQQEFNAFTENRDQNGAR